MDQELVKKNRWLNDNKITVNHSIGNFIIFSFRNNLKLLVLTLSKDYIVLTDSVNFLGVIFNECLNFKLDMCQRYSKISKSFEVLHRLNEFYTKQQLKNIFNSSVVPHISYAIEPWYLGSSSSSSRIIVLQRKAIFTKFSVSHLTATLMINLNQAEIWRLKIFITQLLVLKCSRL